MAESFEPSWLFHADGRQELVENADIYEMLLATGEWKKTPAEHGIITAPNKEQMQSLLSAGAVMASAPPQAQPGEVGALKDRVAALEDQVKTLFRALDTLHAHLAQYERAMQDMGEVYSVHERRLQQIDARLSQMPQEDESQGRRGRKE